MGLFGRDSGTAGREPVETTIGASATIEGALRSDGGVRVNGTFKGNIEVVGNVVIGETGRVHGDVAARNVSVAGAVHGNVSVSEQLTILSGGQVIGDIAAASLDIAPGGMHQGFTRMSGFEQRALTPPRDEGASREPSKPTAADGGTVDVKARPAAPPAPGPRERRPAAGDLDDLDDIDIEPVIPDDIVIEDVADGKSTPGGATGRRPAQPYGGQRRRR